MEKKSNHLAPGESEEDLQRQLERARAREHLEDVFKKEIQEEEEAEYKQQLQSEIKKITESTFTVDQLLDMYNRGLISKEKLQETIRSTHQSSLQAFLKLADLCDQKGFYKIADKIDAIIRKAEVKKYTIQVVKKESFSVEVDAPDIMIAQSIASDAIDNTELTYTKYGNVKVTLKGVELIL